MLYLAVGFIKLAKIFRAYVFFPSFYPVALILISKWDDQPADEILNVFDAYNDPAVVCQWGFMASVFLKGLVSVAKHCVDVVYTQNDLKSLPMFHSMPMSFFPYITSMRNVFLDGGDSYQGSADVAVNAGFFNVTLPSEAVTDAATIDAFNPLSTILEAVPSNIISAFSSNNSILAVVVVAIIIGLCMNALGEKTDPLKKVLESGSEIINYYLTFLINKVGPVAIFCLISRTFAVYGTEYLAPAAAYIVSAMITLFILVVTLYPIGIWITTGLNPIKFIKKIAKVGVLGFSTNSSAACLPLNMRTCINELGCSEESSSFVLPTGMTINMNGTTVMHMFAAVFIATSAGIDVTPANLVVVAFLSICAAMGCPAIPIAGTTLIVTILSGMGWTSDACMIAYALVVAINRPVEMALLPLNVIGDATVNVIVNKKEKELNEEVYNS